MFYQLFRFNRKTQMLTDMFSAEPSQTTSSRQRDDVDIFRSESGRWSLMKTTGQNKSVLIINNTTLTLIAWTVNIKPIGKTDF
jgi:hypothetical protein